MSEERRAPAFRPGTYSIHSDGYADAWLGPDHRFGMGYTPAISGADNPVASVEYYVGPAMSGVNRPAGNLAGWTRVASSNDLAGTLSSEAYILQMIERDLAGKSVATIIGGQNPRSFGVDKSESHLAQPLFPEPLAIAVRQFATELCRIVAEDPAALERIEWRDVERLLAVALKDIGFDVELTNPSKDGGKDIVARCRARDADRTFYIEVKQWKHKRVGETEVRKFVQVNLADSTDGGLFLSTSGYSGTVYQHRAEVTEDIVRLGTRDAVVTFAQHAVRSRSGLWLKHPYARFSLSSPYSTQSIGGISDLGDAIRRDGCQDRHG